MKKIPFSLLLLMTIMLSSCYALKSNTTFAQIQRGMTKEEVIQLCKKPLYQRFDDFGEEWEYRAVVSNYWSVIIVNFENDRVVALNMFKEQVSTPSIPVAPGNLSGSDFEYRSAPGIPLSRRVMSESEFIAFHNSLKNGFSSDRLKKIKEVSLTSAQCKALVDVFTFTSEKIEAMKVMYSRVVDKRNYYMVIDKLTFSSERDQVRSYIEQYERNNK